MKFIFTIFSVKKTPTRIYSQSHICLCLCTLLGSLSICYPITSNAAFVIKTKTGDKQVTLSWSSVKKATGYGVCYATEAIIDINDCSNYPNGKWRNLKGNTINITQLKNHKKYYFRVLAKNANGTLAVSEIAKALPHKPSSLNDTGINNSLCYLLDSNPSVDDLGDHMVSCDSLAARELSKQQDGMVGRDVTANDYNDGYVGFSFTKIGADGEALPVTASHWTCVKDNVTGLLWENKTSDGGLHDDSKRFTNNSANQGLADDASGFIFALNQQNFCGISSWRLPTVEELHSIVDYSTTFQGISRDTTFFQNNASSSWTSSACVVEADCTWIVDLTYGSVYSFPTEVDTKLSIRLVSFQ